MYQIAYDKGWGRTRIANTLNAHLDFVKRRGPISESLAGSIMAHTIYKGLFRFNFLANDIEDAEPVFVFDADSELAFLQAADARGFPVHFTLAKTGIRSALRAAASHAGCGAALTKGNGVIRLDSSREEEERVQ